MIKRNLILIGLLIVSIFTHSCSTVPVTGRSQLHLIPSSQIMAMSFSQYDEFLKANKISQDAQQTAKVKNVGKKIQSAVERYFKENNMSEHLKGYNWEFNLVESQDVNAWCMPGGKVVFYTGILPICKDENGIAVVMGHEIAHAVAEHGGERMSQGLIAQLGGIGLSLALEKYPEQTQNLWMTAYGIGAQLGVLLPFSRLHESEADHLGLIFMAMAGFEPNYAVEFWQRMASQKSNSAPPEFLSTHPSDQTRINNLKKLMPEALQYYKKQ